MRDTLKAVADSAFATERTAIRDLLARPPRDGSSTWHQVGLHVARLVNDPKRYGENAVERLAIEMGMPAAVLYRHASIAEDAARLHTEAAGRPGLPEPLSWTHVVARARTAAASLRRNAIGPSFTDRPRGNHEAPEPSLRASLEDGIALAGRAVERLRTSIDVASHDASSFTPGDENEEALLAESVNALEELEEMVTTALRQLQQARSSGHRVRAAAPVPVDAEDKLAAPRRRGER